jgi:methylmalonyl-CoA/ethylmalonyl-CoA epimerase
VIDKIHHIGVAVKSIDGALHAFQDALGLPVQGTEELPGLGLKTAFLQVGESRIELLEPTDDKGTVAKFLRIRGEGIHHICLQVADIETALEQARAKGLQLIDEKPRVGAGGGRVAFIHPSSTHGVLIELEEVQGCH